LHARARCVKRMAMSQRAAQSQRILVVGPSWVGDIVMSQCLMKALRTREPDAPIDVLAPAALAPLLRRMPEVEGVVESPFRHGVLALADRFALGRSLAGRYGAAYVLPGSWKSAIVPFMAGARRRCGYLGEVRWGLLNDIRPLPPSMKRKTATLYQALVEPDVFTEPSRLRAPALIVDAENQARSLKAFGLSRGSFAIFAPGAEFGPAKRWPSRHWVDLAKSLDRAGLRTVLLGSRSDSEMGTEIARGRPFILDLTGRTRIEDAIDLIAASRFAVSNDSGLMHVAAAVGCKVAAVYGPTSPDDTPALSETSRSVSLALPCSPCRERVCRLGHMNCLERLGAVEVLTALATLEPAIGLRRH